MPLKDLEKSLIRILKANRNPESLVAGTAVLLRDPNSPRRAQELDVFHNAAESVAGHLQLFFP